MTETYRQREGVFLIGVCGEYLLAADQKGRRHCPYLTAINETSAVLWKHLAQPRTEESCIERLREEYEDADAEMLRDNVHEFIRRMTENGYLTAERTEG